MAQARMRRLPGIRVDAAPAVAAEALPRMDIAVLVGLAATGPLHLPVALDSVAQYAAVFGPDASLAWDTETGAPARAHLGPAVRSFFANGGRRCWVVRVARCAEGEALRRDIGLDRARQLPDIARANRVALPGVLAVDAQGRLAPAMAQARCEGSWSDPLRVRCALQQRAVLVEALQRDSPRPGCCELRTRQALQLGEMLLLGDPEQTCAHAVVQAVETEPDGAAPTRCTLQLVAAFDNAAPLFASPPAALDASVTVDGFITDREARLQPAAGARLQLELALDGVDMPPVGCWAHVKTKAAGDSIWLQVDEAQRAPAVTLTGRAWRALPPRWPAALAAVRSAQRLALDLRCEGFGQPQTLAAAGLAPAHAASWWLQRGDAEYHQGRTPAPLNPRFPLAALESGEQLPRGFVPLGVTALFGPAAAPLPNAHGALERDGLSAWDADIFLDPQLARVEETSLLAHAEALRTLAAEPRARLFGMHALLDIGDDGLFNEASLLALPDAVHAGWELATLAPPPAAPVPPTQPGAAKADRDFSNCAELPPPPVPPAPPAPPPAVRWQLLTPAQRDSRSDALEARWLALHRAALRLAAATGEVFAVLALPGHFRTAEAARHAARLRSLRGDRDAGADAIAQPRTLSFGALVHPWLVAASPGRAGEAALAPPMPPDGALLGVMAARAARRGAWVAPANVPLADVVALTPQLPDTDAQALQDAQVNCIRRDPRGLLMLSADTLVRDGDAELRPINVRRLLSLLRRLALRRGARWVFEPLGDVLRRAVQRSFDELLGELFRRGAFAGASPASAFRVVSDQTLQSARDADSGRFVIELRVAPSLPMRFIGLRLVQSGERLSVVETL